MHTTPSFNPSLFIQEVFLSAITSSVTDTQLHFSYYNHFWQENQEQFVNHEKSPPLKQHRKAPREAGREITT